MIEDLFARSGLWTWWIIGMILMAIEIFAPVSFFLWFGLAAFAVGALTLFFGLDNALWGWQAQALVFAALAIVFVIAGRKIMDRRGWDDSDTPGLNERGARLIGTHAILTEAITAGTGRARIGDTTWRVKGPDMEAGKRVVVVAKDGGTLVVEAA